MAASTNDDFKKQLRKTEEGTEQRKNRHGKQPHQRMKPYLVLDYLMRNSDEDPAQHDEEPHVQSTYDIADYLEDSFGIHTDRRSLYDDIEEINKILFMLQSMDTKQFFRPCVFLLLLPLKTPVLSCVSSVFDDF